MMNYSNDPVSTNGMMTPTTAYSNQSPATSYGNPPQAPSYSTPMGYNPFFNQAQTGYGGFGLGPGTAGGYTVGPWNQPMGSRGYYGAMCSQIMNQNQPMSNNESTINHTPEGPCQREVGQCNTMNFNGPYTPPVFGQGFGSKDWSQMPLEFTTPSTSMQSLGGQTMFPTPDASFSSASSSPAGIGFCPPAHSFISPHAQLNLSLEDLEDHRSDKLAEVSGRLLLLTDSMKYPFSVGEAERRTSPPESLHASLLNGILRVAKGRVNAEKLISDLAAVNIHLPVGRRKLYPTTTFTSLSEAETDKMAKDFERLLNTEGGWLEISRDMQSAVDVQVLQQQVTVSRMVFDPLLRLFQSIPRHPGDIKPRSTHEEAINKFSRLTHGFGHIALRNFLEYVDEIFKKLMKEASNPPDLMGNFNTGCSSQDPFSPMPSCSVAQPFQGAPPAMFMPENFTSNLQYTGQPVDLSQASTSFPSFPPYPSNNSEEHQRTVMNQVFETILGRLCLLGNSTKYKITVGEMARRIASPETLHVSLLNGILRNGKNSKGGGKDLMDRLGKYGIQLQAKRRKSVQNTAFTALCEGEAIRLANDFDKLLCRFGGANEIHEQLRLMEFAGTRDQFEKSTAALRYLITSIKKCYERVPLDPAEQNLYTGTDSQIAITKFSLLTHGFGNVAALAILSFVEAICIGPKCLERHQLSNDLTHQFGFM